MPSTDSPESKAKRRHKVVYDVAVAEAPPNSPTTKKARVQDVLSPSKEERDQEKRMAKIFAASASQPTRIRRDETLFDVATAEDFLKEKEQISTSSSLAEPSNEPNWWDMLEKLTAFHRDHRNCNVPDHFQDKELYYWVENQRQLFNQIDSHLSTRQRAALAAIGLNMERWKEMCQNLEKYAYKHGHVNVTARQDSSLQQWIEEQRNPVHPLSQEQRDMLNAIPGWNPAVSEGRFQTMLSRLQAYKEHHGDCNPTEDASLTEWLQTMQENLKILPPKHRKALNELGWSPTKRRKRQQSSPKQGEPEPEEGLEMLKKLQAYHREHGNLKVTEEQDSELFEWIRTESQAYLNFQMTDRRIGALRMLGFDFKPTTSLDWKAMLDYLKAFRTHFGHSNVPHPCEDHPELGEWVKGQRMAYQSKSLLKEHQAQLEELDFVWDIQQLPRKWRAMINSLKRFKNKFGDCLVPAKYPDDTGLAEWVENVRQDYTNKKVSDGQKQALQVMGFFWGTQSAAGQERVWNAMFFRLARYKEEKGDCLVPTHYDNDPQLGAWVRKQRSVASSLSKDRYHLLESIGFVWRIRAKSHIFEEVRDKREGKNNKAWKEQVWDTQYEKLKTLFEQQGHSNVPKEHQLKVWVNTQRTNYRLKKMPQHRVDKLEAINFPWSLERSWNDQYEKMKRYKEEKGHCHVPHSFNKEDPNLVQWVSRQRNLFKTGSLPQERIDLLTEIGFVWDATGFRGNKGSQAKAAAVATLIGKKTYRERMTINNQKLQTQQAKLKANQEELDSQQNKLEENGEILEFLLQHFNKRGGRKRSL